MSSFISLLISVLIFSFLIFIHEFGHFITAKLSGVQVNEFAIFMGPAIWKKQKGETLYSIRCIPFGGYCAMEGEDSETDNPRSFQKAAWWKRMIILLAGAFMNFVAGLLILAIVFSTSVAYVEPVINKFEDYATVDDHGLQLGDRFVEIDGSKVLLMNDVSMLLTLNPGDYHDLVVERDGELVSLDNFYLERHEITLEDGTTGKLCGFSYGEVVEFTFATKLQHICYTAIDWIRSVGWSLQMLVSGQAGISDMSGPVGIVGQMTDMAASSATWLDALMNLLYFGAYIAVNLAVMNLLPIPALDGGRAVALLLTVAAEAILGRKIDPKYEGYIHGAGMILLLALMAFILFKDIFTLF